MDALSLNPADESSFLYSGVAAVRRIAAATQQG
jgi:hypothetical protein